MKTLYRKGRFSLIFNSWAFMPHWKISRDVVAYVGAFFLTVRAELKGDVERGPAVIRLREGAPDSVGCYLFTKGPKDDEWLVVEWVTREDLAFEEQNPGLLWGTRLYCPIDVVWPKAEEDKDGEPGR